MGERLKLPEEGQVKDFDQRVQKIADVPQGPENLLFDLARVPNVLVDRMVLPKTTYQDFRKKLEEITSTLGRKPITLVLCTGGIYRSRLLAERLLEEDLVILTPLNKEEGEENKARGLGINRGLKDVVFDFSEEGIAILNGEKNKTSIDLLILSLGASDKDYSDGLLGLGKIAAFLDQGLKPITRLQQPFTILWLEGIEEDLGKWMPPNQTKE